MNPHIRQLIVGTQAVFEKTAAYVASTEAALQEVRQKEAARLRTQEKFASAADEFLGELEASGLVTGSQRQQLAVSIQSDPSGVFRICRSAMKAASVGMDGSVSEIRQHQEDDRNPMRGFEDLVRQHAGIPDQSTVPGLF